MTQREVHVLGGQATNGWRTRALYSAHNALENDFALVSALRDKLRDGRARGSAGELLAQLQRALHQTRADAALCLRLFSEHRTLASYKGLSSAVTLYAAGRAPALRVVAFAQTLKTVFAGVLPLSLVITTGRLLQRVDGAAAARFVRTCVTELLDVASVQASDVADEAVHSFVRGSTATWRDELGRALALEIDCCYSANAEDGVAQLYRSHAEQLRPCVGESMLQQLAAYAQRRRSDALLERACTAARAAQRKDATLLAGDDGHVAATTQPGSTVTPLVPSSSTAAAAATTTTTTTTTTTRSPAAATSVDTHAASSGRQGVWGIVRALSCQPPARWRSHTGLVVLLTALLVLVTWLVRRGLTTRLLPSLRAVATLTRHTPQRRTLTL